MSENWDIGKLGCLKNGASDERRRYGMSDKWHFGKLELKTILSVSSPTLVWELSEKWAVWEVECLESELTPKYVVVKAHYFTVDSVLFHFLNDNTALITFSWIMLKFLCTACLFCIPRFLCVNQIKKVLRKFLLLKSAKNLRKSTTRGGH